MGSDMSHHQKFVDEVYKGYTKRPFDKKFVLYFAEKYRLDHDKRNITFWRFCSIDWLPEDFNDNMFNTFSSIGIPYYLIKAFSIIATKSLQILTVFIKHLRNIGKLYRKIKLVDASHLEYRPIKLDISLENLKYMYENYNEILDYNHLFVKAIRNGDVDIYDYLKDKVTDFVEYLMAINNNNLKSIKEIETVSMSILTDIWQYHPELIKVIDCNNTIRLSNYDPNVIFLMFMANKLSHPYCIADMIENSTDLIIINILEYALDNIATGIFMKYYTSIPDNRINKIFTSSYERRIKN